MIQKHQIIELETIVPQLIKINEVIREVVEKIVTVTIREEVIVEVPVEVEKIVQVISNNVQIKTVDVIKEKTVEVNKLREVVNTQNFIEKEIQLVDRVEKTEVPVYTTVERIVEVPQILEKIVERIVIMPQVVEVLKYVHEIVETEGLGIAVGVEIGVQEAKYRELYGLTKKQIEVLLIELRKLKNNQPDFRGYIDLIEKFLIEFDRFAAVQRIVAVDREIIVEKEINKAVLVPTKDSASLRSELALSLLVEKLILEIKRIKKDNPNVTLKLDDDVGLIFFTELYNKQSISVSTDFTNSLKQYTDSAISKLKQLGGSWTSDHELILNTVLEERFAMAHLVKQANLEIEKVRTISDKRSQALK